MLHLQFRNSFVNEDVYDVYRDVNRKLNEDLYPATSACLNEAVDSRAQH